MPLVASPVPFASNDPTMTEVARSIGGPPYVVPTNRVVNMNLNDDRQLDLKPIRLHMLRHA